ncbi:hypothetical protein [Nonomuraea angiospora]|uniref:hypothetical protein n=1 Tax=Nonomuraea angiospora TaxID=46172 RepID=UPI0029A580FF|nr:hypothetical protein [Nonomuraea angiospora]MDX3100002.1 hypothetical protein [Nonomuraea angiospora]
MTVHDRHPVLARMTAVAGPALIALCVAILTSGCGLWFQKTIRVEAGAVDEVQSIGRVIAQTQDDPRFENTIQVDDILILDVGAQSSEEGMRVAQSRLEQRGWIPAGEGPTFKAMTSTRWKHTSLSLRSFMSDDSYGIEVRDLVDKEVSGDQTDRSKYVIVVIAPAPQ